MRAAVPAARRGACAASGAGYEPGPLLDHVRRERTVGVLLVRLGGHAAGVFTGETAGATRRSAAGSCTAATARAARARGASRAAARARRARPCRRRPTSPCACCVPAVARLDAVVLGGDRRALDEVLADERLAPLRPLVAERVLDVPDPRLPSCATPPQRFLATVVRPSGRIAVVNRSGPRGMVAAGHPLTRGGRRAHPARGRQRGRRRGRRRARLLGGRAAADRPGRRRLHARGRRGRGADAAGLLRRGARPRRRPGRRAPTLAAVEVSFGDAVQVFNCGAGVVRHLRLARRASRPRSSAGARWPPPTSPRPRRRWRARACRSTPRRPTSSRSSSRSSCSTPEARAAFAPDGPGRCARASASARAELAETIERFGAEGAAPFYTRRPRRRGRRLARARAAGSSRAPTSPPTSRSPRAPVRATYRGRQVLTNPPPSAGGTLLALAHGAPRRAHGRRRRRRVEHRRRHGGGPGAAHARRSSRASSSPGFADRFLASRLGSTTHISVLDGDGRACAVTCTNGEGSGVVVPGHRHPRQQRHGRAGPQPAGLLHLPAGAPDAVDDGADGRARRPTARSSSCSAARAPTASARRSCRSSSASSTTGCDARDAVLAPRAALRGRRRLRRAGRRRRRAARRPGARCVAFRDRNLFFGGVQAVERDPATGALSGAGDPRRGGAAVAA